MRFRNVVVFLLGLVLGAVVGCQHPTPKPPSKATGYGHSSFDPVARDLVATSHPFVASIVQSVPGVIHNIVSTPADLKPVANWLDAFIVIGVLVAGAGIGIYFAETTLRSLAIILLLVGGSIGALALFVRTTLWMSYWVSGGFVLAAVAVLVYEVYRNRALIDSDVTTELTITKAPVALSPVTPTASLSPVHAAPVTPKA